MTVKGVDYFACRALQDEFDTVLREWLKPEEYHAVMMENHRRNDGRTCASHDYCDANMAMDAAFQRVGLGHLVDPEQYGDDGMSQDASDLWNAAWSAWRKEHNEAIEAARNDR